MLFNSTSFFVFFSLFFPCYWLFRHQLVLRNALILIGSYVFYGAWDWRFLSLIIISTLVDFYCGRRIHESESLRERSLFLFISLAVNIGILATFKYFGFFVQSFIDLLTAFGLEPGEFSLHIILPVGISFYTFQTLSYSLDIYRRHLVPTSSLLNFAAFVAFFPQLVAGPIERARSLLPQIEKEVPFRLTYLRDGAVLVLWGLFKKVVIADRLAPYVDTVFASPNTFGPSAILLAVLFFSVQIYCDFSGYSDVARGLAKMLGIDLVVNFRTPYFAVSLQDFWRRWHISLSTWFRDYVFVPLGGSRTSGFKIHRNIFATFLLSGLWHGANYTFIIWGALHALGYLMDPFSKNTGNDGKSLWLRTALGWFYVFFIVQLAWIFFRAASLDSALYMVELLFSPTSWIDEGLASGIEAGMTRSEMGISVALIGFLLVIDRILKRNALEEVLPAWPMTVRWIFSWVLLVGFLMLSPSDTGSFIYFQF